MKKIIAALACSSLFTGCMLTDMKKNMDEMHDATVSMNNKMNDTNAGMAKTNELVSAAHKDGRHGGAASARAKALEDLEKAENASAKFAAAIEFMYGMEFQIWRPNLDSNDLRLSMFAQSIREFNNKAKNYIHNMDDVSGTACAEKNANICVLTGALHEVDAATQAQNVKAPISLFDIFAEGVDLNVKLTNGEVDFASLVPYQQQLSYYKDELVYFMRQRHNFLMAYAFSLMTQNDAGDSMKGLDKIFLGLKSGKLNFKWKPHFKQMGDGEFQRMYLFAEYVLATREVLVRNGIDLMADKTIVNLYRNINWSKVTPVKKADETMKETILRENVEKLKEAVDKITAI